LGILEVLEEHGIVPDIIAGVSAGALVAALYAHGMPVSAMIREASRLAKARLIDWDLSFWTLGKFLLVYPLSRLGLRRPPKDGLPKGFIRGKRLEAYVARLLRRYPHLRMPCLLLATDVFNAETVVFGSFPQLPGLPSDHHYIPLSPPDWPQAVRASCSLPGVFQPLLFHDRWLVDGAVRNTLPADLLFRAGAEKVIAVDLQLGELADRRMDSFVDVIDRSLTLLLADMAALRLSPYPVLRLAPPIPEIGWTQFHRIPECIETGRQFARTHFPVIRKYLESSSPRP
jgi:NTE family protein